MQVDEPPPNAAQAKGAVIDLSIHMNKSSWMVDVTNC